MNIDDLTIGEARKIASMFPPAPQAIGLQAEPQQSLNDMLGKKAIIRTYSAGVWFGTLDQKAGNEVIVTYARRLWRWWAAESISLSAVAIHGVKDKSDIVAPVASVWLEAIEIIPCSEAAIASLESAPHVQAQ
jgi:hypothetical protein